MKTYKRKPIIVEAIQWTGNNMEEIKSFCPEVIFKQYHVAFNPECKTEVIIQEDIAEESDFIVKSSDGKKCYVIPEEVFYKEYEEVNQ